MTPFARWIVALLLLFQGAALAAPQTVRFPRPEFEGDKRFDYARQLLELALSRTGTEYRIQLAAVAMNQERQAVELEEGRTIDVAPIPASAEREARLLAVRIPVNRGVLGWRLGLIRRGEADRFAHVNTLKDMQGLRIAQGQEWPDTQILGANGIEVITAPKYEGLFDMLTGRRFDYFPRGVTEIWDELESRSGALEVEPRIVLHYHYDAYFMVNKRNTRLAQDITRGLESAIADGSFDKLFDQYFGERLRKAQLNKRVLIELKNPLLTPGTPIDRPELWYDFRRWPAKPAK